MTLIVGCVSTFSNYYNKQVDNLLTKIGCKLRYSTKIEHYNWNKRLKYIIRLLFVSDMEWYGLYATFSTEKIVRHRYVTEGGDYCDTLWQGGEGGHNRQKLALRRHCWTALDSTSGRYNHQRCNQRLCSRFNHLFNLHTHQHKIVPLFCKFFKC